MPLSLCTIFHKASTDTWRRIEEGRALNYPLGEETLTDLFIRYLLRLHPANVRIRAYNKREEGKTGADWEWWFRGRTDKRWVGLRVQAKVIAHHKDQFEHLHYKSPSSTEHQCDKLIREAYADSSMPRVPLYCLYSYWNSSAYAALYKCHCRVKSLPDSYGCSIMAAEKVQWLRTSISSKAPIGNNVQDTLPHSWPLPSLFCYPIGGRGTLIDNLLSTLDLMGALRPHIDYRIETVPYYVLELQKSNPSSGLDRQPNLDFVIDLPDSLAGLIVIDEYTGEDS